MSKRLFIAMDISDEARTVVTDLIGNVRNGPVMKGVRWVRPENLHVTVKFLGDTEPGVEARLIRTLGEIAADTPPFELSLGGPGALGKRVLSVKIDPDGPTLFSLVQRIEDVCEPLGFKREVRRYHPHLTVARIGDPRRAAPLVRTFQDTAIPRVRSEVKRLTLYESRLTPTGSVYTEAASFPFEGDR